MPKFFPYHAKPKHLFMKHSCRKIPLAIDIEFFELRQNDFFASFVYNLS